MELVWDGIGVMLNASSQSIVLGWDVPDETVMTYRRSCLVVHKWATSCTQPYPSKSAVAKLQIKDLFCVPPTIPMDPNAV